MYEKKHFFKIFAMFIAFNMLLGCAPLDKYTISHVAINSADQDIYLLMVEDIEHAPVTPKTQLWRKSSDLNTLKLITTINAKDHSENKIITDIAWDEAHHRIIIIDSESSAVQTIHPDTGFGEMLSKGVRYNIDIILL